MCEKKFSIQRICLWNLLSLLSGVAIQVWHQCGKHNRTLSYFCSEVSLATTDCWTSDRPSSICISIQNWIFIELKFSWSFCWLFVLQKHKKLLNKTQNNNHTKYIFFLFELTKTTKVFYKHFFFSSFIDLAIFTALKLKLMLLCSFLILKIWSNILVCCMWHSALPSTEAK